jgi:AsmA protein
MSFEGGVRLDGTMDLSGTVSLAPTTIQRLTAGKVTPTAPIPVAVKVTGPAWSPEVSGVDVKPAATAIAKQAATGLAGQLLGDRAKPVQAIIEGGEERARAEEVRKKLEEAAGAEQERARQRAEEEAKKRLRGLFGK